MDNITITNYLREKGIEWREHGDELITKCVFADCDADSKGKEAHLYIHKEKGVYDCKKCGAKGNFRTLQKHFGDEPKKKTRQKFNAELIEKCHQELPEHIREYLNKRGISDEVINERKLGYGSFYRKHWITIPIKDIYGNYSFFKLRQDPADGSDKVTYPKGIEAQVYDWQTLKNTQDELFIAEGEMDCLALLSGGVKAISSTHGAGTFKQEWAEKLIGIKTIYLCYDRDEAGRKGAERVAEMLHELGHEGVNIIVLPEGVGEHGDVTDYLVKLGGSVSELKSLAKEYPERIDTSQFSPLTANELIETLGLTIKHDAENKLATFLCELSAYTESAQFNISYNAPSSTGKSFIPTEIARLFPEDDVMEIAYCSPTAFFHDVGEFDKERNQHLVDLSRKILIFLDQPHNDLLARLRPLLSHDKKEITLKITDKSQKSGLRTKTVLLRGYPAVIFCTAGLSIDEQEATRFLLLSPEIHQEKLRQGISATIRKEADSESFKQWLNEDPKRALLKERIRAIKLERIHDINLDDSKRIEEKFLGDAKKLKPRHQRDIKRLLALIKAFAVLNVWWREREGDAVVANTDDITEAFKLWDKLAVSQELNLPPYIYNLYREVILTAWQEKNSNRESFEQVTGKLGISRQEVLEKHYAVYGRMLDNSQLRQQILPMLETAGLITQEQDVSDKRKMLIFPTDHDAGNSGDEGGVTNETDDYDF